MKAMNMLSALVLVTVPLLSQGDSGNGLLQERIELLEDENAYQQMLIDQNIEDIAELSSGSGGGSALMLVDSNGASVGHVASIDYVESSNSRNATATVRFPAGDGHAFGRFYAVRPIPEDSIIYFDGPDCTGSGYSERGAGGTDFLERKFVGRTYVGLDAYGNPLFHSAVYAVGERTTSTVTYQSRIDLRYRGDEWLCFPGGGTTPGLMYEIDRVDPMTIEERFPPPYAIESR